MKKMISLLALSSMMLMAVPVSAVDQEIVGEGTGDIPVNGTLGMDNTDPTAPIVEGEDSWINVSLPTETIFYSTNTKQDAPITSPKYTITNNSGRPVDIYYNGLTSNGTYDDISYNLNLKGFDSDLAIRTVKDLSVNRSKLITLANGNGNMDEAGTTTGENTVTYEYTGKVNEELTNKIQHSYTMTLEFEAVDWTAAP